MLELTSVRKTKINLDDYNAEQDIHNRMLMADFSSFDLDVLEEILFSPLKISLKKLSRNLETDEEDLLVILKKLSEGGLLTIEGDTLLVDKEMRKYFEFQIARFSSDFQPDMEFVQGLLKKVPIHILPVWYSIPRTSNNIFESIVEKYLLTPQTYQRYLLELNFSDPTIHSIIQDLFQTEDYKVYSSDIISKYNLTRRQFEEIMLHLEFSFICCLAYEKEDDHWVEFITPFQEWKEYLLFLKNTETPTLPSEGILPSQESDFAYILEMEGALKKIETTPQPFEEGKLIEKITLVRLAEVVDGKLQITEMGREWLKMAMEDRSIYLYRHPMNRLLSYPESSEIATDKNIREAEKAVKRVLHGKWVLFDEFFKGVMIHLNDDSTITLKRKGKHWSYALPVYSEEESKLIQSIFFEWLFELGVVRTGSFEGKDCFSVTEFGRSFFQD